MRCADLISCRPLLIGAVILGVCLAALPPALAQTYWFETYDRMVTLIDEGKMSEASTLLGQLLKEHPYPISCQRIPGDRCINYLPYYQRARIQLRAGDIRRADHSLDISSAFGAVLKSKRSESAYLSLRQQIEVKTAEIEGSARNVAPASKSN